ncbi:MAG TPA: hypothetical protein VHD63_20900, partial [Ktedonobacteraceae bacterium]|nr:hypothetical protein [Ktedonobacteraceae bacterium]
PDRLLANLTVSWQTWSSPGKSGRLLANLAVSWQIWPSPSLFLIASCGVRQAFPNSREFGIIRGSQAYS